jgi:protein-S-isoprenylcysteine O-methyltransferase Ste14
MNTPTLITGTIIIIVFSWNFSIRHKRYHGIARFFSFESIFILLLMNLQVWFKNPLSPYQIISWIFLITSIYPGIAGYLTLRRFGKSEKNFENTTSLVSTGIYKYIRHPLYCSLLLLGSGIAFKNPEGPQIILGLINIIAVFFTAIIEEGEMTDRFGTEYQEYMKKTKRFIPGII